MVKHSSTQPSASKNRLVRLPNSEAIDAFEKEAGLLKQVQNGELSQVLMLWQAKSSTLVLPAGKKWPISHTLTSALKTSGWDLYSRKTGGAPVPQRPGIINLSYIYSLESHQEYDIRATYLHLCRILQSFFERFGVKTDIHATPGSYCDGDYNLNINGKKIVGTAQRVLLKKEGGRVVLSQACILIDADMDDIVAPVNLCNLHCGHPETIKADVHTALLEHVESKPTTDSLFQALTEAFLNNTSHPQA
ncbi:lipoate--protein ligase family protein [Thaumasiovibrio subtropicus]|uniref:lipoate--protein ligase family protein n=1 Tax=Thaumasiovibrio subtropicus TaxID=1891207 RepID=UPI000B35314B|nr:lipoate--protein ligase [Thaumasiovibrio subtropicus]